MRIFCRIVPAIYQFREYAVAGGLINYGPDIVESYRNCIEASRPCSAMRDECRRLLPTRNYFIAIGRESRRDAGTAKRAFLTHTGQKSFTCGCGPYYARFA
jgi:hypothetical protein